MTFKELKQKSISELHQLLAVKRDKLREFRFKDANKQLKTVRDIRQLRQEIAWILTLLNAYKPEPAVKTVKQENTVTDQPVVDKIEKQDKQEENNK